VEHIRVVWERKAAGEREGGREERGGKV